MTFFDISILAESLRSLSIAPLLLIYPLGYLQIASLFSLGKHLQPEYPYQKACLTPLSTAGVSENTVSVATGSCLLGMLSAGFLDLRSFLIGNVLGMETPH